MFNITNLNNQSVSLAKALLVFYVIMASQQNDLLGKQLKEFIQTNRLVQHVIGFIMMIVVINIIGGIQETDKLLFYSLIAYVWFIFSTKLDIQWNLILILLLLLWFLYENRLASNFYMTEKDSNVSNDIKKVISADNMNFNMYIVSGLIIITLTGVYLYSHKKGIQYGGGEYNPIKFLLY